MKKVLIVIYFLLAGTLSEAVADYGPYYIVDLDYCTEYKLYLTPDNFIYGTEIGCSYRDNRRPPGFTGILSYERDSFFLIEAEPQLTNGDFPEDSIMIIEYNFYTMVATAYVTNGYTFRYYGDWDWEIYIR